MEQWVMDHAAGLSSAFIALSGLMAWWWHRRRREPELPPMSARWLSAKDRFRAPYRDRGAPSRAWAIDGWDADPILDDELFTYL